MAMMAGLLSLFALASCSEEKDEDPYVKIDGQTEYNLTSEKKDITVKILTNRDWSVRMSDSAAEWVAVSPKSGKAAEKGVEVTVSVLENTAGNRTATVEFYTGTASATLTLNQEGPKGDSGDEIGKPEGEGTEASPYNVSKALTLLANGKASENDVYVTGKITDIEEVSTEYGNATYTIIDEDYPDNKLIVYRGYYYDGDKFTAEDQIKVGDVVVVLGKLTVFYEDNEISTGSKIISINGEKPAVIEYTDATIESLIASPVAGNYRIQNGQVVNVPSKNIVIINDGTGDLYVYKKSHGLAEGDVATFSGEVKLYYDTILELDSPTIEKTGTKEVVRPDAVLWSAEDIDAYFSSKPVTVKYVTVSGSVAKNGGYYRLEINRSGEISATNETDGSSDADNTGDASGCEYINIFNGSEIDLEEYVGRVVDLTGYAYNVVNTESNKYVTVSLVDIAIDTTKEYVTVDRSSVNWLTQDRSAKTVTVDASGSFTVTADEESFTGGSVWATATVKDNVITITPDASTANVTERIYGKFIVTSGDKTAAIDVSAAVFTTHPYTSNVTWAIDNTNKASYEETATINDESDTPVVKIGTGSKLGSFTVTIPAGTKKLSFYALAWNKKACSITIAGTGSSEDLTVALTANSGVSNNAPYTVTTTDAEAYHEVEILDATATELTISSTDAKKARAIFWGINSYSE